MSTYTAEQLKEILEKHQKWLKGTRGGERANLSGADLSGASFSGVYLSGANFSGANLSGASFAGAYLSRADFSGANFSGANLSIAYLRGANLSGANLRGANLYQTPGKDIITFQAGQDFAYYVDGNVRIGCEFHSLEHWLENYDAIGEANSYTKQQIKDYGNWLKWLAKRF